MVALVFVSAIFLFLNNLGTKLNKVKGSGKLLSIVLLVGVASILSWGTALIARERVTKDMLPYSLLFAVVFVVGVLCAYQAYDRGSMGATSLFGNSSLVVVVLFGVLFYDEPFGWMQIVGVLGVLFALTMLALPEQKEEGKSFNWLWLVFCLVILFSNSSLSVASKFRQKTVGGANPFAYMAFCFTMTFVVSAITYAITQFKNNTLKEDLLSAKENALPLTVQTVGNTGSNLLVTFLSSRVDGSLLYPVNMGLGLIITVLCGFIVFKEKPTWKNVTGIAVGVVAIILLNI